MGKGKEDETEGRAPDSSCAEAAPAAGDLLSTRAPAADGGVAFSRVGTAAMGLVPLRWQREGFSSR